jgi:hypothetical protein
MNSGLEGDGIKDKNWVGEKTFPREEMCPQGCIMGKEEMGLEKSCSLIRK